jgi:hypothetical protein
MELLRVINYHLLPFNTSFIYNERIETNACHPCQAIERVGTRVSGQTGQPRSVRDWRLQAGDTLPSRRFTTPFAWREWQCTHPAVTRSVGV